MSTEAKHREVKKNYKVEKENVHKNIGREKKRENGRKRTNYELRNTFKEQCI